MTWRTRVCACNPGGGSRKATSHLALVNQNVTMMKVYISKVSHGSTISRTGNTCKGILLWFWRLLVS